MPNISLKIPKGFYANGTDRDQKGRWNSGKLVRWIDQTLRPIGGSRRWVTTPLPSKNWRGMHAWLDLSKTKWLAFGAFDAFQATKGSGSDFFDITPADLTTGRQDADYEDGYGYGFYGNGSYGDPIAQNEDGFLDPATTWSIDNFGEILIACSSDDGRVFNWDLNTNSGSNLLTNGDFSQAFGLIAGSNGDGSGGWVESPSVSNQGWEIDTTAKTCTLTPHFTNPSIKNVVKGLTVGQKYRVLGTSTTSASGVSKISIRSTAGTHVTDLNSNSTIFAKTYNMSSQTQSPYFAANSTDMEIVIQGVTTSSSSAVTLSNFTWVSEPVLTPISGAPTNNQSILVTDERFVFCLGAGGNPRKIQWSDREDRNTWTPAATNEAGDIELSDVGKIMCGVKTRGQTLILTTTSAHTMRYIGAPYVYSTNIAGTNCGVISAKAAANTEVGVFWMGEKNFYYFDGNVVRDLKCDVEDFVFNDFNYPQKSKVFAWVNSKYNEVWWHYNNSSTYNDPASYKEPNRYVSYNYVENYWMIGEMITRTSGIDSGVFDYPMLMWNLGSQGGTQIAYIQEHEVGNGNGSYASVETGAIELDEADQIMKVLGLYPSVNDRSDVRVKLYHRQYDGDDWVLSKTFLCDKGKIDTRFSARQLKLEVEGVENKSWRFGNLRMEVIKGGKR